MKKLLGLCLFFSLIFLTGCVSFFPLNNSDRSLLPRDTDMAGWFYQINPYSLEKKPLMAYLQEKPIWYQQARIEKLESACFRNSEVEGQLFTIDIYKIDHQVERFMLFSQLRSYDDQVNNITEYSFNTEKQLVFLLGDYLVELNLTKENENNLALLNEIALIIKNNIGAQNKSLPAYFYKVDNSTAHCKLYNKRNPYLLPVDLLIEKKIKEDEKERIIFYTKKFEPEAGGILYNKFLNEHDFKVTTANNIFIAVGKIADRDILLTWTGRQILGLADANLADQEFLLLTLKEFNK